MAKDIDYVRMIHTARWLRLRRAKLSACPLCERCAEEGRVEPASEVHHVTPVEDGLTARDKEALMYDPHNLRALCHACHVRTHTELGRCGRAHARRRAAEQLERFRQRFTETSPGALFLNGGALP